MLFLTAADDAAGAVGLGAGILFFCFFAALYFAPTIVAALRGHHQTAAIAVVNLLLGCSGVGWAIALAWAFTATSGRNRGARVDLRRYR